MIHDLVQLIIFLNRFEPKAFLMKKYILIFCSITLLYACKNKKEVTETTSISKEELVEVQENSTKTTEENSKVNKIENKDLVQLVGKYWKLTEINGEAVKVDENSKEPHIKFTTNTQFTGHGGCNSFFGEFKVDAKRYISFSNIGMTERECSYNHYDQKLVDALSIPAQFILVGEDELRLQVGKRMPHAKFKAIYF